MHLTRVTLVVLWKLGCKVVRLKERDQSERGQGGSGRAKGLEGRV